LVFSCDDRSIGGDGAALHSPVVAPFFDENAFLFVLLKYKSPAEDKPMSARLPPGILVHMQQGHAPARAKKIAPAIDDLSALRDAGFSD